MTVRKSTKIWLAVFAVSLIAILVNGGDANRLNGVAWVFRLALTTACFVLAWRGIAALFRLIVRRLTLRLAFSYFLIGIVPIPLLALLLFSGLYIFAHQFAANRLRREATALGEEALREPSNLPLVRAEASGGIEASDAPWLPPGSRAPWPADLDRSGFLVHEEGVWLAVPERAGLAVRLLPLEDPAGGWLQRLADRTGYTVWVEMGESRRKGFEVRGSPRSHRKRPEYRPRNAPPPGRTLWTREWIHAFYVETVLNAREEKIESGENVVLLAAKTSPRFFSDQLFSQGVTGISRVFFAVLSGLSLALLIVYLAAVAIAFVLVGTIVRNVNRLTRASEAVARGDLTVRVNSRSKDQIGDLARAFDGMAASIQGLLVEAVEKERLKGEIEVARTIHQNLLPPAAVERRGFTAIATFEPLAEIGGDYFDFLPMADGRTAVAVGDVSGHGLSTGLVVAMSKSALTILLESGVSGGEVFRRLNELIRRSTEAHRSMTLALFAYDAGTRTGELTNAGQIPPYRLGRDAIEALALPSFPLGLSDRRTFPTRRFDFAAGERLVFVTDGFVEALDPAGEPFGFERLESLLETHRAAPATEIRDALRQAIAAHVAGGASRDDRTLVLLTLE